jgi:hypothetical protein
MLQADEKGSAGEKNLKSGSYFGHSRGGRNPGLYFNLLISKQKALNPGFRGVTILWIFLYSCEIDPFFISLAGRKSGNEAVAHLKTSSEKKLDCKPIRK